jgi:protein-tyrosine phosphatase
MTDRPDRTEILPDLYIGGKDSEVGFDGLVIDVREKTPAKVGAIHLPVFRGVNGDWTADPLIALQAVDAIAKGLEAGQKVLVRCGSGVERSPAVVALYLVRKHGLTPTEAYRRIREARPQVIEEYDLLPLSYEERTR